MNKIKNILSPGYKVDDETLYGSNYHSSPAARRLSVDKDAMGEGNNGEQLHSTSPIAQKDKGLMSNPDGDKFDDTRFTKTASTEAQNTTGTQPIESAAAKDKGMRRQIMNPNDDKLDQTRYGTGPPPPDFQPSSSHYFTGPIINQRDTPSSTGQTKLQYSQSSTSNYLGPAAAASTGSAAASSVADSHLGPGATTDSSSISRTPGGASTASNASIKSGILGKAPTGSSLLREPAHQDTLPQIPATGGRFLDDDGTTQNRTQTSERSFPLSGGQRADTNTSSGSHIGRDAALVDSTGMAVVGAHEAWKRHDQDPSSISVQPTDPVAGTPNTAGGNHGREGLAAAAAAAAVHDHGGEGHEFRGDPCEQPSSEPISGPKFSEGPHLMESANRLDPRLDNKGMWPMPGSFPRSDSEFSHPGGADYMKEPSDVQSAKPVEHHYGREAALAGAGAATAGTSYEASRQPPNRAGPTETDPAPHTIGPHKSDVLNILDPRVQPDPQKMKSNRSGPTATDPAPHTVGPHKSDTMNVIDPRVQPQPEKMKDPTTTGPHHSDTLNRMDPKVGSQPTRTADAGDHRLGRDAAFAGGAGAAGAGAYEIYKHHNKDHGQSGGLRESVITGERGSIGSKSNPYSSSILDPRVDSPSHHISRPNSREVGGPGFTGTGADGSMGSQMKTQDGHHYGRDTALVGGAGATGIGVYEAAKHHDRKENASMNQSSTAPAQSPATAQPVTAYRPTATAYGESTGTTPPQRQDRHHHGRDAAILGGTGTAGAGAYEASKYPRDKGSTAYAQSPAMATQHYATAQPSTTNQPTTTSTQPQHHYSRDAAIAGETGAAGLGAYEAAKRQGPHDTVDPLASSAHPRAMEGYEDQRAVPHHPVHQVGRSPQPDSKDHHKGHDAAVLGAVGATGADISHEHSKRDSSGDKLEKERAKETAKAEKRHEKEVEKEEKRHHHGFFGKILHRHKDKHEDEPASADSPRQSKKSEETALGAGTVGFGAYEYDSPHGSQHGRNKLHKEPPKGYQQQHGGMEGEDQEYSTHDQGYLTKHQDTTAMGAGEDNQGIVTEPHTGLPMNVGKYGDGHGGTDANPNIGGYHAR